MLGKLLEAGVRSVAQQRRRNLSHARCSAAAAGANVDRKAAKLSVVFCV